MRVAPSSAPVGKEKRLPRSNIIVYCTSQLAVGSRLLGPSMAQVLRTPSGRVDRLSCRSIESWWTHQKPSLQRPASLRLVPGCLGLPWPKSFGLPPVAWIGCPADPSNPGGPTKSLRCNGQPACGWFQVAWAVHGPSPSDSLRSRGSAVLPIHRILVGPPNRLRCKRLPVR